MKQLKPSDKIIGVTMRVVEDGHYREPRDSVSHDWTVFLERCGYRFILIPNGLKDLAGFLSGFNWGGFILTGGDDPLIGKVGLDKKAGVLPNHVKRDMTEVKLIRYAISAEVPLLGVCRGMQMLNLYFKGKTMKIANHVAINHRVEITDPIFKKILKRSFLTVNSYHGRGIAIPDLGRNLRPWAILDGMVEAFFHRKSKICGVMWHPERNKKIEGADKNLLKYVFD